MTREIINIKINKVMTRKKRTKEEQPLTTEVVGAKKKSPKKKKAVEEKPVVVQEQEASVNEPTTQENVAENTFTGYAPEEMKQRLKILLHQREKITEKIYLPLWMIGTKMMMKKFQMKSLICLIKHLKRKDSVTLTLSGWKGISKNMRKLKRNANFILMKC